MSTAQALRTLEAKTGIVRFDQLVADVMDQEPYRSARRVCWVLLTRGDHVTSRVAPAFGAVW